VRNRKKTEKKILSLNIEKGNQEKKKGIVKCMLLCVTITTEEAKNVHPPRLKGGKKKKPTTKIEVRPFSHLAAENREGGAWEQQH